MVEREPSFSFVVFNRGVVHRLISLKKKKKKKIVNYDVLITELILVWLVQDVLRELGQKKPQLDELVHTAEALRADTNRQQVHGKGKLIFIRFNAF